MEDKEAMTKGAKTCWNKFSHFTDKFTEIIFIAGLTIVSLYNFIVMFTKTGSFNLITLMLSIYLLVLATMIYKSWKSDITFLMYFGFLRGKLSKTLFLLFCACMTFPRDSKDKNAWVWTNMILSYGLCAVSVAQILKYFNKDEEKESMVNE